MPSYERGAYEPSDNVHVFDGREDDDDEEGSRLPLLIVMALLVLAAFGGVVWLAYERGVASGRTEPRVLTAEQGPAKVAPSSPGGSESPYKGLKIYEQPAPSDEEADTQAAPTAAPAKPPVQAMTPASVPSASTMPSPQTAELTPAAKPAAAPKPAPAKPVQTASAAPVVAPKPAPSASVVATAAAAKPKPDVETASLPPATSSAPKPVAAPAAATATSGGYVLQIGAYKSQAEAEDSWKSFAAKHSVLMSGFSPDVKQVDLGDKGVWYRLRVGSFPDKDAATALCEKLKADGGNCFLAR